ncbi:MAG: hypothetical protein QM779_08200 [Propionicimonas sp.]|uniref:hypothetical protein n=1 Tax=Propionicimonas sp. TaxID=1955623 RepID=UPI003D14CE50
MPTNKYPGRRRGALSNLKPRPPIKGAAPGEGADPIAAAAAEARSTLADAIDKFDAAAAAGDGVTEEDAAALRGAAGDAFDKLNDAIGAEGPGEYPTAWLGTTRHAHAQA